MIFQGIDVSGSFDVTGSFVTAKGDAFPLTASSVQGDMFFHTTFDTMYVFTTSGSWKPIGDITSSTPPSPFSTNIEYLVVAGGGAGSSYGGGGAGGYLSSSIDSVTSGSTYTVTIGGGGAGSGNSYSGVGAAGTNSTIAGSTISTVTAVGGGYGGNNDATAAGDGGSGGGGSDGPTDASGGSGTVGQGNDGGDGSYSDPNYMGGGGGGAGAAGGDGISTGTTTSGAGGAGLASKITGQARFRAGGGGGVRFNTSGNIGAGGAGGGGNGGTWSGGTSAISSATAGTANTGGGGGAGQNGGKGVAIFAYDSGSFSGTGGKITSRTDGYVVHTFKASSTFTVGGPSDFPTSQIPTTNLVLHLDPTNSTSYGGSGTTITNLGTGPNASLINGAGFTDNYWTLDGSNDYISSVDDGSYDIAASADFTMIVWVYVTTSSQYGHFMAWDSQNTGAFKAAPSAYSYQIYWYSPSYTTYNNLSTTYTYGMNAWYQLAMVRRSGVWEAYKNGALIGNDADAGQTNAAYSCTNLYMGYGGVSEWAAQRRGPMFLYNGTALTSNQISLNYDHYKGDYGLS